MRKGEKMKISEFFEYNNQQVLEENEEYIRVFGTDFWEINGDRSRRKKEFTFGKVNRSCNR